MSDVNDAGNSENYRKCPSCDAFAVHLCTSGQVAFFGDQDNDAGEESQYHDIEAPMVRDIELYAHICMECGHIADIGLEWPENKVIYRAEKGSEANDE